LWCIDTTPTIVGTGRALHTCVRLANQGMCNITKHKQSEPVSVRNDRDRRYFMQKSKIYKHRLLLRTQKSRETA